MMRLIEEMIADAALQSTGSTSVEWDGAEIDLDRLNRRRRQLGNILFGPNHHGDESRGDRGGPDVAIALPPRKDLVRVHVVSPGNH